MAAAPERSFIVEFVGLPGAGKTTIAHAVADALRADGKTVFEQTFDITQAPNRRSLKAGLALSSLWRHPRLSAEGLYRIGKSRQKTLQDFASASFNLLYIIGLMGKISREPGIHFIDQGYYNAFWTIYFSASTSRPENLDIQSILASGTVPRADLVLLVETRPETVLERLRARPGAGSRLERQFDTPDFDRRFDAAIQAFERVRALLDAARTRDGVAVATIHNDSSLDDDRLEHVKRTVRTAMSGVMRDGDRRPAPAGSRACSPISAAGSGGAAGQAESG